MYVVINPVIEHLSQGGKVPPVLRFDYILVRSRKEGKGGWDGGKEGGRESGREGGR